MLTTIQLFGDIAVNEAGTPAHGAWVSCATNEPEQKGLHCTVDYQEAGRRTRKPGLESVKWLVAELQPADIRIANWEAPLIGSEGINKEKIVALATTKEMSAGFSALKLDVASIANNHIFDCLLSGYENTVSFLRSAGTIAVGAGATPEEAEKPAIIERNGATVVVLAYVDRSTDPFHAPDRNMFVNILEEERALSEVGLWVKQGAIVIVSLHWGMDYLAHPAPKQRAFARRLVDAGATLVVGHHPHCLQGHEQWGNGHIFYSLGNFLCNRIKPGVPLPRMSESTAAVTCDIEGGRVTDVRVQSFTSRDLIMKKDEYARGTRRLRTLSRALELPEEEYKRHWERSRAYHLFIFRPVEFLRVNRYPWRILGKLKLSHVTERIRYVREIAGLK